MTLPRSTLVSLQTKPHYHCNGRFVRRAFLCGVDRYSGQSFKHRRGWIVDKLAELSNLFAIDVASYAVMSNHYHLVLKINADMATEWSDREVVKHWCSLFAGHTLVQRYRARESMSHAELKQTSVFIEQYRSRLISLSWFMRCLNESIARMANAEDGCTGRFWEGRFKSQALLDEAAVVACMAYVDLNPMRTGMVDTTEDSDYTSVQQRIRTIDTEVTPSNSSESLPHLMSLDGQMDQPNELPIGLNDYLELVDWTGRAIHPNKSRHIPELYPAILDRLQLNPEAF